MHSIKYDFQVEGWWHVWTELMRNFFYLLVAILFWSRKLNWRELLDSRRPCDTVVDEMIKTTLLNYDETKNTTTWES